MQAVHRYGFCATGLMTVVLAALAWMRGVVALSLTFVSLAGFVSVWPLREAAKADTVVDCLDLAGFESRETRNQLQDFIRDELPSDARLMLLNTNQGYWVEREFISEASQLDWLFRQRETTAELQGLMHELNVDFVVWYGRYWKVDYPPSFNSWLRDQSYTRAVYQQEPYVIVQMAPPAAE